MNAFRHAKIIDDGRPRRGVKIQCGACGREESVPINTTTGGRSADEIEDQMAARKFLLRGWLVGKHPRNHRCSSCLAVAANQKEAEKMKVVPMSTAPIASQPKPMGRDDRRVIFEKLNDVYLDENRGYEAPWTDKTLAEDLGVPMAWVMQVREEMFGPIGVNGEIQKLLADVQSKLEEFKKISQSIMDERGQLEKRLIDIAKAVRP